MERELGISECKKKSEQVYDSIMTLINRKIDKIRQKAFLGSDSTSVASKDAAGPPESTYAHWESSADIAVRSPLHTTPGRVGGEGE